MMIRNDDFSRLEINLSGCLDNYKYFRSRLDDSTKLLVLVKANAYGHGAVEFASLMEEAGADYLAVAYPVEGMEFSITLPGTPEELPAFTSTYHPESMDSYLEYTVAGSVISGYFLQGLKDHETLTMTLPVTGKLFPQDIAKRWSLSYDDLIQYALLLLAAAAGGFCKLLLRPLLPPTAAFLLSGLIAKPAERLQRIGLCTRRFGCGFFHHGAVLGANGLSDHRNGPASPGAAAQDHGHGQRAQRI